MTGQVISQMPATSLADLTEVANGMQNYIRAANAESRQAALDAANKRGLLQRIFPTQYEREKQRIGVQNLRQLSDARRDMLEVYTETQIEIARKRADALVAAQGMHLQTQLAAFATEKIQDLNDTVNRARQKFMDDMAPQFTAVANYQHIPELHEPAYQSVLHQIRVYFDFNAALLDGFIQSLNNRVGQIQQ